MSRVSFSCARCRLLSAFGLGQAIDDVVVKRSYLGVGAVVTDRPDEDREVRSAERGSKWMGPDTLVSLH